MAKEKYYRNRRIESFKRSMHMLMDLTTSKKSDIGKLSLKSIEKIELQLKEWHDRVNDSSFIPEKQEKTGE